MISRTRALAMTLFLIAPLTANSGVPAARQTDSGQAGFHAGSGIVTGSSNVLINGLPAARAGDSTLCPQVCVIPFPPSAIPHSAGSVVSGSATVLINGNPAARLGDVILEPGTPGQCQPSHSVTTGSSDVLIGP